ncbi:hypothetical protein [Delftia tsuruhatensis]|uniref:hypothetical protein n=1 Tax=Delftia tsuruhatensis TaxID=180282 RepID=UPI0023DB6EB2|nr:hypothetical protein [Delftia tsuruhatensis]WEM00065.1 hypothetical protein PW274_07205 [Delftia tsuruhatensis]
MKKEHPHAQVLRWIADGETVQLRNAGHEFDVWTDMGSGHSDLMGCLAVSHGSFNGFEFRIKPKTITVGDREIEAPVMSGPGYFITESGFELQFFADSRDTAGYADVQKRGHVFASIEAARAAQEAITALLTREPS